MSASRDFAWFAVAAWRPKFRGTRHLLDTLQAILSKHMPLTGD
jgi:hypothetical protein